MRKREETRLDLTIAMRRNKVIAVVAAVPLTEPEDEH